jgi:Na+/H+-dicarboxylate symporter
MIIIPLTVSSIVVALGEIDTGSAGKLGKRTFLYYLSTTVVATVLGLVLVKVIRPGEDSNSKTDVENEPSQITAFDSFLDLLRYTFYFVLYDNFAFKHVLYGEKEIKL